MSSFTPSKIKVGKLKATLLLLIAPAPIKLNLYPLSYKCSGNTSQTQLFKCRYTTIQITILPSVLIVTQRTKRHFVFPDSSKQSGRLADSTPLRA